MLSYIIEFSVKNKLIIGLFVLALIGYGTIQTMNLPIDAVPDITNNQVQVITIAPSFGATDIERLVTFPIEQANSNIPGMLEIRSFSRFGLSLVTIVFDDDTDVYWARQQVSERLQQVQGQIPAGIGTPELAPVSTGLGEIYQYVVKPKKGYENQYDPIELRSIQDWIVRRQLLGVKGVAEVSSFGGKLKQYEIAVQPKKLQAMGLTIHDVFQAVEKNNQNTGGAYIEKGPTALFIRTEGLLGKIEDIKNIAISKNGATSPIFLRDVAEVKIGYATRFGALCYNDEGEVAGAIVMMLKGANSSEVIKNVKDRIAQIQKTLPEGVEIEPFLDRTKMVNNAISTVATNLGEGALIVVFVLVLFLGNFRAGLLVASVIPLAMLFAICMMNAFGVSGNLMSLGALDFGLIVDGAVIIVEAVMHQLSHNAQFKKQGIITTSEMDAQVSSASKKMMNSAVFGQIIILVVYLPIFTLQGIEGKMFKPMAQTVAFALLGAFLLSLTYIPMMSAWVLSKKISSKKNLSDRIMERIENAYQSALTAVLKFPKLVISSVVLMFFISLFVMSQLGGEFIPELEEGDFAVDTRVLTGSNLTTTIESTQQAAGILKKQFPEVLKVVTKIGSGEVPTDPMPMEASDMMIILKHKKEWTSAKTFDELAEKMMAAVSVVPGITVGFQYPVQMRFNELMTGARQDVVCKIFGENLDILAEKANALGKIIRTVEGAVDLYIEPITGMPQVVIEYNRAAIARYQLSISDVNEVVNTAFAGQSTGLVFEGEKRFDLVVRLVDSERKNLEDIQNLLIPSPLGQQIPLSQLANVEIKDGPNQIQREDAKRRIVVGFNVKNRDVQSIVHELEAKVDKTISLPPGYFINYGGAFENLEKAQNRLMIAVPVSLLLIFVLLYFAFNSVKQGLLIYSAIPLSAIGGILFLALRQMPFSISAGVGFIALFGVAVLNGIVLIAEFNRLKASGIQNKALIVVRGTKKRLRPVLMTAFVASLGFLPMALSNGSGAEVQRPLATVVIGGLLIATFLTLFVLPLLYIMFDQTSLKKGRTTKLAMMIPLLFCINLASTQQPITLEDAWQMAKTQHPSLSYAQQKVEQAKTLLPTARALPKTNVYGSFGQVNSALFDTQMGVAQSFSFPKVYQAKQRYLETSIKEKEASKALQSFALEREVTALYGQILFLEEQQALLEKADSLFGKFYDLSTLRLKNGESNQLEATAAAAQKASIYLQLQEVQLELDVAMASLQYALHSTELRKPAPTSLATFQALMFDTTVVSQHPWLQLLNQQTSVAMTQKTLEETKLLPEWNVGYINNSFRGIGPDNKDYSARNRFSALQIGIDIPIFAKAQKAHIEAASQEVSLSQSAYDLTALHLKQQRAMAVLAYEHQLERVQYTEQFALKNAEQIQTTANDQFKNGDITYLDWILLQHQAIAIQSTYTAAKMQLFDTLVNLHFITFN